MAMLNNQMVCIYIYMCVCVMWLLVFQFPAQKHYRIQVYFLPGTTYFLVAFPIANQTNKSSHSAKEDLLINGLCLEGRDNFRLNMAVLLMVGSRSRPLHKICPPWKLTWNSRPFAPCSCWNDYFGGSFWSSQVFVGPLLWIPSTCNAAPHPCLIAHLPTCLTVWHVIHL